MNILSVDTSGSRLGIGVLCADGRALARHWQSDNHSSPLFERISATLSELDVTVSQIDLLAVVSGPGSFTGLRIGMSGLLGWGASAKKPVQAVDTFSAVSAAIPVEFSPLLVAVHSRKDSFLCRLNDLSTGEGRDIFVQDPGSLGEFVKLGDVYVTGPGATRLFALMTAQQTQHCRLLNESLHFPDMLTVCQLAAKKYLADGNPADNHSVEPFYMSASQAEIRFDSSGSAV